MDQFLWLPGHDIDADALYRLRAHFERPKKPMGEAWFMGEERRLFHELRGDLSRLSASELQEPLWEIVSGTSSFGSLAEWQSWYHYLLVQLLPRSHESSGESLLVPLVTGFMVLYPNGVYSEPCRGFLDDVLRTLGRCMMDRRCWNGSEIVVGSILHRAMHANGFWGWRDASGDFSASMFFCLKYLPGPLVQGWLQSVLTIPSPHWRAQVLVWLVGSHDILADRIRWPSEFPYAAYPSVSWHEAHCLRAELAVHDDSGAPPMPSFLPESSRTLVRQVVLAHFSEDVFLAWLLSIARVPYLESELAGIPSDFERLYVRAGRA